MTAHTMISCFKQVIHVQLGAVIDISVQDTGIFNRLTSVTLVALRG